LKKQMHLPTQWPKTKKGFVGFKTLSKYESPENVEETYSIETMMHELTFNEEEILKTIKENYVRYK